MERSHLLLLFAIAFFLMMIGWGIYNHLAAPLPPPSVAPTTHSTLIERLREKREQMIKQRQTTTSTSPSVQ